MNVPKPTLGEPMTEGPDFAAFIYVCVAIALTVLILRWSCQ